jgi:hypothetical protein
MGAWLRYDVVPQRDDLRRAPLDAMIRTGR